MELTASRPTDLLALRRLWQEAFGDTDAFLDDFFSTAYASDRCRVARDGDRVAAALYWLDCSCEGERIAYLYAIATDGAYRGRGVCRALMEDTHVHLLAQGYTGALLVPSNAGLFDLYRKMGYETATYVREICKQAGGEAVSCKRLSKTEYANARAALLPRGGVLQTGENLDFLEKQYALYGGDGFCMAARLADGRLRCAELLGDEAVAGGLLVSLGVKEGSFRLMGTSEDKPFAMYRSLGDASVRPRYFGLAFD